MQKFDIVNTDEPYIVNRLQSYGNDYIASWVNKILPSAVLTKPTQAPMASVEKLQMYVTQLIQLLGMNYLPILKQQHVFVLL